MANSVDPDETPCSAASHLGLYCLLRPVCPNTYGKYGNIHLVDRSIASKCYNFEKNYNLVKLKFNNL